MTLWVDPRAARLVCRVYVDALVLCDRDSNADGTLNERRWVVQDANYNVTVLINDLDSVGEP